jgi:SecD/SecF fusion protein
MSRAVRRALRSTFIFALIVGGTLVLGSAGGAASPELACSLEPQSPSPSFELVYLLQRGEQKVSTRTRDSAATILCERLRKIGITAAEVHPEGPRQIRLVLPGQRNSDGVSRLAHLLAAAGRLGFYQWEADLIGPERVIGGHPGKQPETEALARAEREWKTAGRGVHRGAERRLVFAGAFPGAYGAVRLASKLAPRRHCVACSALTPRFYMFDRTPAHRLIAGPVTKRAELGRSKRGDSTVLKVPPGIAIVSEQPSNETGEILSAAEPGWFALRDRPALTSVDIVDPRQELDEVGRPNVTFGFTKKGRTAFQRVTREIARCGQSGVLGSVTAEEAEALSCHLAVILDGEVKTRPIINFAYNPDGFDGRTGAQISGGFNNIREAQYLAAVLGAGSLPIKLTLVRQGPAAVQNS